MSTRSLKVGDRVAVYGWVQMYHQPYKPRSGGMATVTWVGDGESVHVRFDNNAETDYQVHPKQCRRLKKRERRRVYFALELSGDGYSNGTEIFKSLKPGERVDFIEVRKK